MQNIVNIGQTSNGCFNVSLSLARKLGVTEAVVFGELVDFFEKSNKQEFSVTQKEIGDDIGLSEFVVRKSVKNLQKHNLVTVVAKGIPRRTWYKVNTEIANEFLSN